MLVVSDTSPLSNLAIIERLDLLPEQFGEVLMPPAVERELLALQDDLAQQFLLKARQNGWLKTVPLPATAPSPPELSDLDPGETEALRLALAISADGVLMDEKEGRQCAALLGVRTIGVLGVLIAARRAGSIPVLRPEIEKLRADAGFFIDATLEKRVLEMVGE